MTLQADYCHNLDPQVIYIAKQKHLGCKKSAEATLQTGRHDQKV